MPADHDDTVSLLDLVQVLVRRRWVIAGITVAGAAVTLGILLLSLLLPSTSPWNPLPEIYRPETKVLVVESTDAGGLLSNLGDEGLAGLAQLAGLGGTRASAELAQELLAGRTLQDQIIDEFDFVGRHDLAGDPHWRSTARERVAGALGYEYLPESQVLVIYYLDTDPEFATTVLARVLDLLEQRFHALTMETVRLKKRHLEERLEAVGRDRQEAQDRLVAFQRTYGILDLDAQSEQSATLLAAYKRELLSQEVDLQALLEYLPEDDPAVVERRNRIAIVAQVLDELQTGSQEFSGQTIPQAELPALTVQYLNLQRDLEIQESIHRLLREQYELARIEETDTKRTLQILERPEVPEVRFQPRRSLIGLLGAGAAFLAALLVAFFLEYLRRAQADPVEAAKLATIRRRLRRAPPASAGD